MFLAQLELIDRVIGFVCRRNHLNAADAEDFASHARLKLMDDGYAILRKFQGRSSLKTFLSITLQRLFYDYRIAAWGKWRPSAEARKRGPVAVLLEQLLGRDGHTFEEALEILTVNHRVTETRVDLERIAASLPPRVKRRVEREEALAGIPSRESADDAANEDERRQAAGRVGRALQDLLASMPAQERLILRLRFEDGRTVADIAGMLRLDQKGLYRRLERLFRDLRSGLEGRGVTAEEVSSLMGDALIDLAAAVPETGGGRPSIPRGADAWP
jgi:RNA polymerase sigma factor (sigma-70 family)